MPRKYGEKGTITKDIPMDRAFAESQDGKKSRQARHVELNGRLNDLLDKALTTSDTLEDLLETVRDGRQSETPPREVAKETGENPSLSAFLDSGGFEIVEKINTELNTINEKIVLIRQIIL